MIRSGRNSFQEEPGGPRAASGHPGFLGRWACPARTRGVPRGGRERRADGTELASPLCLFLSLSAVSSESSSCFCPAVCCFVLGLGLHAPLGGWVPLPLRGSAGMRSASSMHITPLLYFSMFTCFDRFPLSLSSSVLCSHF